MRYSRMLTKQPKKKRKYANLIVVLIILGIAAYLISAGAAGGWLAENVINPVFNNSGTNAAELTGENTAAAPIDTGEDAPPQVTAQTVNLPETSGARIEREISAVEISLFTLQSGAFSEENNAKSAASEIQTKGGAGFIAYDGKLYRVLIAGYTDEDSANDVKISLEKDSIATSVFNLKSGGLDFKIGAEQTQVNAVKACFDSVPESVDTLQQIIYDADKGKDVNEDIKSLQQKVTRISDNFHTTVSTEEGAMLRLATYMKEYCETINNIPLSTSVSKVDFSSELKYTLIDIVVDYSSFLEGLNS
ncbi:MAG: SPOR domain-containing protein [Christensenellales bacterium]|jgi:hypothetical protein